MHKQLFSFWMIIVFFCAGCTATSHVTSNATTVTPTPPIILRPLLTVWDMVGQPVFSTEDYSLVIYAIRLTGQDTVLLYYRMGSGAAPLTDLSTAVQLQDEAERTLNILSSGTFTAPDKIEVGFLKFSPRPKGARELVLQVQQSSSESGFIELPIVRLTNPAEDLSVYDTRMYFLGVDQVFEQNGFRISFIGSGAPPVMNSAGAPGAGEGQPGSTQATATPVVITPVATNLPQGVTVTEVATLKIEDASGKIYYVYVQFLSNGEIVGALVK